MPAAGLHHTVLLRSDGMAVACGLNSFGQCNVPSLPGGLRYTQIAAGFYHTVLLRSDGMAVAFGSQEDGRCDIPALDEDRTYIHVAADSTRTTLLRNDGSAWSSCRVGDKKAGDIEVPAHLMKDSAYSQISLGLGYTVLLKTDGKVLASGDNSHGQCDITDTRTSLAHWGADFKYTGIAAAVSHTLLLKSDGHAVAYGDNSKGQCDLPALTAKGTTYTQAAAGQEHTVLLRSDGSVVSCGSNRSGQCDIPSLPRGLTYLRIEVGPDNSLFGDYTVLDNEELPLAKRLKEEKDLLKLPEKGWRDRFLVQDKHGKALDWQFMTDPKNKDKTGFGLPLEDFPVKVFLIDPKPEPPPPEEAKKEEAPKEKKVYGKRGAPKEASAPKAEAAAPKAEAAPKEDT